MPWLVGALSSGRHGVSVTNSKAALAWALVFVRELLLLLLLRQSGLPPPLLPKAAAAAAA